MDPRLDVNGDTKHGLKRSRRKWQATVYLCVSFWYNEMTVSPCLVFNSFYTNAEYRLGFRHTIPTKLPFVSNHRITAINCWLSPRIPIRGVWLAAPTNYKWKRLGHGPPWTLKPPFLEQPRTQNQADRCRDHNFASGVFTVTVRVTRKKCCAHGMAF